MTKELQELIALTKRHLQEEYPQGSFVLADLETCNYFRDHFKKARPATAPVQPSPPKPKAIAATPPPPPPKIVNPPIAAVQTIDPSEFKKLFSEHFPNVSIIDPTKK